MTAIVVCPLSRLAETAIRTGARQVVTLINHGTPVERPASIPAERHLVISMHDICEPAEGMTCPGAEHVEELLGFMRRWDQRDPAIVHCFAGVSRSTASAYASFCALRPDLDEAEIAQRLRRLSPQATPNIRIVGLADEILGRKGRMIRAVEAIGRGAECFEGSVFSLAIDE